MNDDTSLRNSIIEKIRAMSDMLADEDRTAFTDHECAVFQDLTRQLDEVEDRIVPGNREAREARMAKARRWLKIRGAIKSQ